MNNSLKKVFYFFLFLSICVCTFSQESKLEDKKNTDTIENISIESYFNDSISDKELETSGAGEQSMAFQFIKLIVILIFVIVCIYFVLYFLKKNPKYGNSFDPYINKVASLQISSNKSICVITLGEKGYLVGITENSISLISEIDDEQLISSMNLNYEKSVKTKSQYDFASTLQAFWSGKMKKDNSEKFSESVSETEDFLRKQKERLRKNNDEDDL